MSVGRWTRLLGVVFATAAVVTACTTPAAATFDPQRLDVRLARSSTRVAVTSALHQVTGDRPTAASAWMDSCESGAGGPWARRCSYQHSVALTLPDMTTAGRSVEAGLQAASCSNPLALTDQLAGWRQANPGEPAPGDDDFQPGVVAPMVTDCAGGQLWIRLTSPTDPLLDRTVTAAASSTSPILVTARPYDAEATEELRGSTDQVIVLISLSRTYHEEQR